MKPLKQPKINWNEKSETGPKAVVMRRGLPEPLTRGETSKPSYQPRRHETATPNDAHEWRGASDLRNANMTLSPRPVHAPSSAAKSSCRPHSSCPRKCKYK